MSGELTTVSNSVAFIKIRVPASITFLWLLKVLGARLGSLGYNPDLWVDDLSKDRHERFNHFLERAHPIIHILRRGYDALLDDDQLLFMDVALFKPFQQSAFGKTEVYRTYKWLSVVHKSEVNSLKAQVQFFLIVFAHSFDVGHFLRVIFNFVLMKYDVQFHHNCMGKGIIFVKFFFHQFALQCESAENEYTQVKIII